MRVLIAALFCCLIVGCSEQKPTGEQLYQLNKMLQSSKEKEQELGKSRLRYFLQEYPNNYSVNLYFVMALVIDIPTTQCEFNLNGCPSVSKHDKKRLLQAIANLLDNFSENEKKHENIAFLFNFTNLGEHELAVHYYSKFFDAEQLLDEYPKGLLLTYSFAHSLASLDRLDEAEKLVNKVRNVYESPQLDWQHLRFLENFYGPEKALKFVIERKESGKFDRPLHEELCDFYGRQKMVPFQEHCLIEFKKEWGDLSK